MTIASEISRLQGAKTDIKTAIEAKGVTVPSSAKLDSYDDYVAQIEQGGGGDSDSDALCFTANTAGSTVSLTKNGNPTSVTLEMSKNGNSWTTYTIGNTITLNNVGDKVYFRNSSDTDTGFSTSSSNYYRFTMSGSIKGSGNVTYLLNKNGTNTLSSYCFFRLFNGCSSLTDAPRLPATNLNSFCYYYLFSGCSSLKIPPDLPATTLYAHSYRYMFQNCTKLIFLPKLQTTTLTTYSCGGMFQSCTLIKLSTTQSGEYQFPYRIPISSTGTSGEGSLDSMFRKTGGSFAGTPTINTTYYTSNTVLNLDYSSIITMSKDDALGLLNSDPATYYYLFDTQGHIYHGSSGHGIANESNTSYQAFGGRVIVYNLSSKTWSATII